MLERKGGTRVRQTKQITILHGALSIFNQKFGKFGNRGNGTEIYQKRFQKFLKLLNFRNENHSTKNSANSGSKVEWKENFQENIFENLGIPRDVFPFFWKFWKMLFHSLLEVAKNSNRSFWLSGKRPRCA